MSVALLALVGVVIAGSPGALAAQVSQLFSRQLNDDLWQEVELDDGDDGLAIDGLTVSVERTEDDVLGPNYLVINGQRQLAFEGGISFARPFVFSDTTVLLFSIAGGGNACDGGSYGFATARRSGEVSIAFDNLDISLCREPKIKVSQEAEAVSITEPLSIEEGFGHRKWIYRHGSVKHSKFVDGERMRRTPTVKFVERETFSIEGSVVRQSDGKGWELKLAQLTRFESEASKCYSHLESIPLAANVKVPTIGGKQTFDVSVSCGERWAAVDYVTSIAVRDPTRGTFAAGRAPNSAAPTIFGQWRCISENAQEAPAFFSFAESGDVGFNQDDLQYFGSGLSIKGKRASATFAAVKRGQSSFRLDVAAEFELQSVQRERLQFRMLVRGKNLMERTFDCAPWKTAAPAPAPSRPTQAVGDPVAAYANALADELEQGAGPACGAIAAQMRMLGNSNAPDFVRERQVEAMLERVPRVCLR